MLYNCAMDENSQEHKSSFRYLLVLYIVLFVVSVPLVIFSLPHLEESIRSTGIVEHFLLWKSSGSRPDQAVSVTLLSYWGETETKRIVERGYRDELHTVAEAILMPLEDEEKEKGLISPIAPKTRLVGARIVDSIPFLTLSEEFLLSDDINEAARVIEKTLRANLGTEGLVIIVEDETVVSM